MCTGLTTLNLSGCYSLTSLAPLARTASSLLALELYNCEQLTSLSPLSGCTALRWGGGT